MSAKRKPPSKRETYTEGMIEQLLFGRSLKDAGFVCPGSQIAMRLRDPFGNAAMREAWAELRDELLQRWADEGRPGRPFGAWVFDEGRLPPREGER